jgi:adenylate cyclase
MPNPPRPKQLQQRLKAMTEHIESGRLSIDEMWHQMLTQGNVAIKRWRPLYGRLPSNPRCVQCHRPFGGLGGALLRVLQGVRRSPKNRRFCAGCHAFTSQFPGGAEVVLSMLFVDVRGSTTLAEKMNALEFSRLMNRFYQATIGVLVEANAFIDKLVGDEVTALFIPGWAGPEHARRALEAGQALLRAAGYGQPGRPWVPIGVGIHTGAAWVGSIAGASGAAADFTALGDNVNIAARLASLAGPGEILASEAACQAAGIATSELERRVLELKGKRDKVSVRLLQ